MVRYFVVQLHLYIDRLVLIRVENMKDQNDSIKAGSMGDQIDLINLGSMSDQNDLINLGNMSDQIASIKVEKYLGPDLCRRTEKDFRSHNHANTMSMPVS